jgi:hypothetical protein
MSWASNITARCLALGTMVLLFVPSCRHDKERRAGDSGVSQWNMVREVLQEPSIPMRSVDKIEIAPDGSVFAFPFSDATAAWVFDTAGKFLRQLGRAGKGPGEFDAIASIGFFGDTMWAWDRGNDRLTFFRPDGTVASSVNIPGMYPLPLRPKRTATLAMMRLLPDSSAVLEEIRQSGEDEVPDPWIVVRVPQADLAARGKPPRVLDTVALLYDPFHIGRENVIRAGTKTFYPPDLWQAYALFASSSTGDVYAMVDREPKEQEPHTFSITIRMLPGAPKRTVIPYTPVPITEADIDSGWVAYRATMGERKSDWPTDTELRGQYGRALWRPAHVPTVRNLLVSNDTTIWLERPSSNGKQLWEIYDVNAKLIARAEVGRSFKPLAASKRSLYGTETNESGVESIVRYRAK